MIRKNKKTDDSSLQKSKLSAGVDYMSLNTRICDNCYFSMTPVCDKCGNKVNEKYLMTPNNNKFSENIVNTKNSVYSD